MKIYTKERCFQNGFGLFLQRQKIQKAEPEHLHEFVELVYILGGEGIHGIDGVEYAVRRGCLLLINYRQNHYFRTDSEMEFCKAQSRSNRRFFSSLGVGSSMEAAGVPTRGEKIKVKRES